MRTNQKAYRLAGSVHVQMMLHYEGLLLSFSHSFTKCVLLVFKLYVPSSWFFHLVALHCCLSKGKMRWYKVFLPDDDVDDDKRPNQQDQQQNAYDLHQSNGVQPQQKWVEENDHGDKSKGSLRRSGSQQNDEDDYDDYINASQKGQPQDGEDDEDDEDDDDDDNDDDDDQREEASQQQDDNKDAGNIQRGLHQADDNNNDDDDRQKPPKSSSMNINLNGNFDLHLEDSDLHEGGIMFSKKLLVQLFSGPGEHDPNEQEVPVHQVQHEHLETADSGEWTIVELKAQDGKGVTTYLKAKLDSGSDENFMSRDIYKVTGERPLFSCCV